MRGATRCVLDRAVQRALVDHLCLDLAGANGWSARHGTFTQPDGSDAVDGLTGGEGASLACGFWYAEALHQIGRPDEATDIFERLVGLSTDLGPLSEEYDTVAGRQPGNTPQAFSHVGLIHAARTLSWPPGSRRSGAAAGARTLLRRAPVVRALWQDEARVRRRPPPRPD